MSAECTVDYPMNDATTLSVEVSGWDAEGQFFVETADMNVNALGENTARLRHRVNSGSLVFVRLRNELGADAHERSHPAASEAQAIGVPDLAGRSLIRLTPCQPRSLLKLGDQKVGTRI